MKTIITHLTRATNPPKYYVAFSNSCFISENLFSPNLVALFSPVLFSPMSSSPVILKSAAEKVFILSVRTFFSLALVFSSRNCFNVTTSSFCCKIGGLPLTLIGRLVLVPLFLSLVLVGWLVPCSGGSSLGFGWFCCLVPLIDVLLGSSIFVSFGSCFCFPLRDC